MILAYNTWLIGQILCYFGRARVSFGCSKTDDLAEVLTGVYTILSQQRGQTWHGLSGEVPNSMEHISGMDPVVI